MCIRDRISAGQGQGIVGGVGASAPSNLVEREKANANGFAQYQNRRLKQAKDAEKIVADYKAANEKVVKELGLQVVVETQLETKTREVPVQKMRAETKTRQVPVTRMRVEKKTRMVDGKEESYEVNVPYTENVTQNYTCLLYTSPSPRDKRQSRMPSSA